MIRIQSLAIGVAIVCSILAAFTAVSSAQLTSGAFTFGYNGAACNSCDGSCIVGEITPSVIPIQLDEIASLELWWEVVVLLRNGSLLSCGYPISAPYTSPPNPNLAPLWVGNSSELRISAVSAGGFHAAFLASTGEVWAIGVYNATGLGMSVEIPTGPHGKRMLALNKLEVGEKVVSIASGAFCDAVVTSLGNVWMWGSCSVGECGQGYNSTNNTEASLVTYQHGAKHFVRRAVLGNGCNALVTDSYILSAGLNLALGRDIGSNYNETAWFEKVSGSERIAYPLRSITQAGASFLILDSNRKLWAFGIGPIIPDNTGSLQVTDFPNFRFDASIEAISTAYDIAYVLTSSGTVYRWGDSSYDGKIPGLPMITAPIPVQFPADLYNASASIISRLFHTTGGNVVYAAFEPICDTCVILPDGQFGSGTIIISPVTIIGNFSVNATGTIGIEISVDQRKPLLNVTGCASLHGGVELTVKGSPLQSGASSAPKSISIPLIEATCFDALASNVRVHTTLNKCQKMKVSVKQESDSNGRQTLYAVMSVDQSACRVWWIIVASVLGGIVLIAVVVALLGTFYPPFRNLIRPYSAKRAPQSNVN